MKTKFSRKAWIILIIIVGLFLWFIPYMAAMGDTIVQNPIQANNIVELVNILLDWALKLGSPIAAGAIVYAGFLYTTSGGDKAKIDTAKKVITSAIMGLILIILAKSIGFIVRDFFK